MATNMPQDLVRIFNRLSVELASGSKTAFFVSVTALRKLLRVAQGSVTMAIWCSLIWIISRTLTIQSAAASCRIREADRGIFAACEAKNELTALSVLAFEHGCHRVSGIESPRATADFVKTRMPARQQTITETTTAGPAGMS